MTKSNLPLFLKNRKTVKLKSEDVFKEYPIVKSSLLETTKLLPQEFNKPISNFKEYDK